MTRREQKAAAREPVAGTLPAYRPAPAEVTVVFIRAHTHADTGYREGDTLTCTPATAGLLRRFGAIGPVGA